MAVNPLARGFPTQARLGGELYPLNWRFTDCLPIILAYEDENLTLGEQQEITLRRLYRRRPPQELTGAALVQATLFLDGGGSNSEEEQETDEEHPGDDLRLYSFSRDGGLIYSAFRGQYGIDLRQDELHWWAFLSLFHDLSPDCRFYQLLRLRRGWLEGTLSREEEQLFDDMGPSAKPPRQPGDREREAAANKFWAELEGGGASVR